MIGAPDPMMLFPAATEFTPFSVIRNISSNPVSVTPELFWMDHSSAHRKATAALAIVAGGTVVVDTHALLQQAGLADYNGMLNLTYKTTSPSTALLMASGSVDQTGTYVFQVLPHEARESMAKTISYWSTANGNDTMVTVWNPADEAQDFLFTLNYSGGSYTLPLHLEARASRLFNIASLIHDQAPDQQGNIIPATIFEGSALIAGVHGKNERILVDVDAGTYNVRKGTCQYGCTSCGGAVTISISSTFFSFSISYQQQLNILEKTDTGSSYTYTSSMQWNSNNTGVATMANAYGMTNGVGLGNSTISAFNNNFPIYDANWCAYNVSCPAMGYMSTSAPVTVVKFMVFGSTTMTYGSTGNLSITGQGFTSSSFMGSPYISYPGITFGLPSVTSGTNINIPLHSTLRLNRWLST